MDFVYEHFLGDLDLFNRTSVHRGFGSVALELWTKIGPVITKYLEDGTLGQITITGHSAGGSSAAALGLIMAKMLSSGNLQHQLIRVVVFGAPNIGGRKTCKALSELTVFCAIKNIVDPFVKVPCARFPHCPNHKLSTGRKLGQFFQFHPHPGKILADIETLPKPWMHLLAPSAIFACQITELARRKPLC